MNILIDKYENEKWQIKTDLSETQNGVGKIKG